MGAGTGGAAITAVAAAAANGFVISAFRGSGSVGAEYGFALQKAWQRFYVALQLRQ